ncbi:hypothetical protein SSPS47_11290 [Streptomyces sp. S4.7]|uniref:DUF6300 family protein n=1 Tax=Streptomyces sp. S4.7 TaxID=2705439 RepID=UPI0013996005|nr:DUF6300 family protein [Streptomyces sp. S4.7]QHY95702.1 hypothetical protein SSPS47_11290 [Streptomyces sp. S4.7]
MNDEQEYEIRLSQTPPCGHCDQPTLLTAAFPSPMTNARGDGVKGLCEVALCRTCDYGEPAANGLLAFFTVHERLDEVDLWTFNELVVAWVDVARRRQVDQVQLDAEYERWREGVL